ncbi:MAG: hypothetical protein ACRC2U_18445 [Aeromonas sp.]
MRGFAALSLIWSMWHLLALILAPLAAWRKGGGRAGLISLVLFVASWACLLAGVPLPAFLFWLINTLYTWRQISHLRLWVRQEVKLSAREKKIIKQRKKATELKKVGKYHEALQALKMAYQLVSAKERKNLSPQTLLRLPLFLQLCQRPQEAWDVYHWLMRSSQANTSGYAALDAYIQADIYDKVRLFLQREKQPLAAVAYGMARYFLMAQANYHRAHMPPVPVSFFDEDADEEYLESHAQNKQETTDHLIEMLDDKNISNCLVALLKKAKSEALTEKVMAVLAPFKKNLSRLKGEDVVIAVMAVLNATPPYPTNRLTECPY